MILTLIEDKQAGGWWLADYWLDWGTQKFGTSKLMTGFFGTKERMLELAHDIQEKGIYDPSVQLAAQYLDYLPTRIARFMS